MESKEFYTRLRKLLDDNMLVLIEHNADANELNELAMELNRRIDQCNVQIPDFMQNNFKSVNMDNIVAFKSK